MSFSPSTPRREEQPMDDTITYRRGPSIWRQLTSRKYYRKNAEPLKEKARKRAQAERERRSQNETPADAASRKERHRIAAAKYREKNRKTLKEKERRRRPGYKAWISDHEKQAREGNEFSRWVIESEAEALA